MSLNKQSGNMYPFVSHTWNAIKGKCSHDCSYCYMKRFPQKSLRLDEKELEIDLGKGNFIFVGSSCDMFAVNVPTNWIRKVIAHCRKFDNKYLFQSKDPERMTQLLEFMPKNSVLATTIETNRLYKFSQAPPVTERLWHIQQDKFPVMISIEPIMAFDLDILVNWFKYIQPLQVVIGADSKKSNLPEPSAEKVWKLIKNLRKFTKVILKSNLQRIIKNLCV